MLLPVERTSLAIDSAETRFVGPVTDTAPSKRLPGPKTGAATLRNDRVISSFSTATPVSLTLASSSSRTPRTTMVYGVWAVSGSAMTSSSNASGRWASITFPVAVQCIGARPAILDGAEWL